MENSDGNIDWRSSCPISSALDVLGDKWSLLIIRDLIIHGPRTYSQLLESPERISTNILASRLNLLTCLKLIERTNPEAASRNNAYRLTAGGAALRPVLEALGNWAGTHLSDFHANIVKLP
ncbi:MAG: winged helix-turn-helix transcriptional regulator [Caldilineaceae bacterium]